MKSEYILKDIPEAWMNEKNVVQEKCAQVEEEEEDPFFHCFFVWPHLTAVSIAYQCVLVNFPVWGEHGLHHELVAVLLIGVEIERLKAHWKGKGGETEGGNKGFCCLNE